MRRTRTLPAGTIHRLNLDSKALTGNGLGEPAGRTLDLYVPAGRDGAGLPLLVDLAGFTSGGLALTNWRPFGENVPERLDRLIGTGALEPVVVAFPDAFTRLGGNQYVNSPVMGCWEDFLADELAPFVEARFGCGGPGRRGLFGHSSGGYGALVNGMRRSDVWAAIACHSGDMGFDLLYRHEFPQVLRALARHGMSIEGFIAAVEGKPRPSGDDTLVLMILAQAASFDPDPGAFLGLRLPVDPETCELMPERWRNWLAWDPVEMLTVHAEGLRRLKALYVDCGDADEYNLLYGARRLHRGLDRLGIGHTYEEFPGTHSGADERLDRSLPLLVRALT